MRKYAINRLLHATALVFLMIGLVGKSDGASYFVAPWGSDANTGTQLAPFKTIQKAANKMVAGDTCYIRAGTYRETVVPANSGSAKAPVTFEAFQGERVIVSGADLISSPWRRYSANVYTAAMPWTLGPDKDMVFVDGIPVMQARHPNNHTSDSERKPPPIGLSPLWMTFGNFHVHADSSDISNPTDLDQHQKDYWKGAIYVGWHGWGWVLQSAEVESSGRGYISVKNKTRKWWFPDTVRKFEERFSWFHQGYLTHHLNALDKQGEWHWQNNKLYLWPPDSTHPSDHLVEAKKRHLAFDLRNREYIHLRGLRVFASSVTMYNSNHCLIDRCRISFVSHFTGFDDARDGYIDDYKAQHSDGPPQRGEVGVYVGGRNNEIRNSVIKYSAGAGLILGGYRTTVTNNIIHDCGYGGTYLGCIFITYDPSAERENLRGGHTVTHNELYHSGRALISVSSDERRKPKKQSVYEAMDIGYNRLHDGAITANDAGGAFNSWMTTLGSGNSRTQLHHNLIWGLWGQFWNALVYPDNKVYGIDIHHNVLWTRPGGPRNGPQFPNIFFHQNRPGDSRYFDNIEKSDYEGGVADLKDSDYPDGFFETGATIQDEEDSWYP